MQLINVQKGRALLDWGGVVLGETLSSFENLRDGRIFSRMLAIAQRSVDDDYMEFDDIKMSLDNVYNLLSVMYTSKVMKCVNLNQAQIGNELELAKILLLILAVGVKSPLSQCFTSPSFTLEASTQNSIMTVMDRAFRDCQQLSDMKGTFYEGLLDENMDETIESPIGTSTPNTPKACRKTLLPNVIASGDVASVCGSPAAKDKGLNVSITTMLRMRHNRICQFEQKLATEKILRNEIEAELQLKDDLLENKTNKVSELEEKIASMEKSLRVMKEDQTLLVNEMTECRRMSQESYLDLNARYEHVCKDLDEFRTRNAFLEKENVNLYDERHKVIQLHAKLEKYRGMEEEFSRSRSKVDELETQEKEFVKHFEEMQNRIYSLESVLNDEREYHKDNMDSMKSQYEKNLVPMTAECLGDIIQDDLKGNIMELEKQLEEKEDILEELTSQFNAQIENLNKEKSDLQDAISISDAKVRYLQYDVQTLTAKLESAGSINATLESCISEKEETMRGLRSEMEELNNDLQRRSEERTKLEENIAKLKDDLAASGKMLEDSKHEEILRTKELQDSESERKNLIQRLEVEKVKKEEAEEVLSRTCVEKEALSSEIRALKEIKNSLERDNDALKAECDDFKEEIIDKNVTIGTLESDLTARNEKIKQILTEFTDTKEAHDQQLARKVEEIEMMKIEVDESNSLLQKLNIDLSEKDCFLRENETLIGELNCKVLTLESDLDNEKDALETLNSEHTNLNGVLSELKSQYSTIKKHNEELMNGLNLKSEQVVELEERVFKIEQILHEERITHNATENHLKVELQKSTESCEVLQKKCSRIEANLTEQIDVIQRIGRDDELMKDEMKRQQNEASHRFEEMKTLNDNLTSQLNNSNCKVHTLESDLESEKEAFETLNSEHTILNGVLSELKSQYSTIKKHNEELMNDLNEKSEQVVELEEKVFKLEQILHEERIMHNATENHLKVELQKSTESCEVLQKKCSRIEVNLSEQVDTIQRIGRDDELMKDEMKRQQNEASHRFEEIQTLNNNLTSQLNNVVNEKDRIENLYIEKENSLTKEIQSLRQENDELNLRLESQINDISMQKKSHGTQLETLESNLKSFQKASESDKIVLNTQRQLIQKLEAKSRNDDTRISDLTRKFQENEGVLNQQVESLDMRLKEEIVEKENIRLTLDTLSENNLKLSNVVETLHSSREATISELGERIRLEMDHECRRLRDALENKEVEINHYREQLKDYEGEDVLKERIHGLKEERNLLASTLEDVQHTLGAKQQELDILIAERTQICNETERSQKEMDVLRSEIQDNNKVIRQLRDELVKLKVTANHRRSSESAMNQLTSILQDQREILSLSTTSSKTCENEDCIKAKQELMKNVKEYENKLKVRNDGDDKTVRPRPAPSASEARGNPIDYFMTTDQFLESVRHAGDFGRNSRSSLQRCPLVPVSDNASRTTSEKIGSVDEDKQSSVFATLPRMKDGFQDPEMKENKMPRGLGLGYLLRSEDEPDHMEWGFLEQHHFENSRPPSDSAFGGTNFELGQMRRLSLSSEGSNSTASNKTSRKLSLGASSTTFSSFHPASKQETFGLHSIAEDDQRVEEIKRRNTLCLPHLKSSYPLEQLQPVVPDEDLKRFASRNEPVRTSIRDKRKSPHKKFSFNSPSTRRLKEFKTKGETPTKRGHAFTINLSPVTQRSQKSDSSVTSGEESILKKTKNVTYSIGFTPKKALAKLVFKKKKEDKVNIL